MVKMSSHYVIKMQTETGQTIIRAHGKTEKQVKDDFDKKIQEKGLA